MSTDTKYSLIADGVGPVEVTVSDRAPAMHFSSCMGAAARSRSEGSRIFLPAEVRE